MSLKFLSKSITSVDVDVSSTVELGVTSKSSGDSTGVLVVTIFSVVCSVSSEGVVKEARSGREVEANGTVFSDEFMSVSLGHCTVIKRGHCGGQ